jgi:hypothetical protein
VKNSKLMYVIVTSLVFCISRVSPLISLIIRRPCFVVNVMQVDQRLELIVRVELESKCSFSLTVSIHSFLFHILFTFISYSSTYKNHCILIKQ